ncbi:hypothetical protein [Mycobacterium shigaense]|uniref:hypothetical protein n=1 Tax=Mycobacterium shigaense TaxID=722731 RepID=UPI000E569CA3|nr:hypothetical protein [Mycobacterium shigaense]MEA1123764.1 hypothetical protein [Mycobacterium shigaense]
MMVLAAVCALTVAACFGYCVGRRAASTPPTWKKRTRRITLARSAVGLLVLVTARHLQRRLATEARIVASLRLLRVGMARLRPY